MTKVFLRVSILSLAAVPALMLSACGGSGGSNNSATEPYYGVPYTHERTAGTGVAYVRGKLMPPRETNTQMIVPQKPVEPPKTEAPPPPVTQGDKIFDKRQAK